MAALQVEDCAEFLSAGRDFRFVMRESELLAVETDANWVFVCGLQKLQEILGGGAQEEQRVNRPLTIAAQETADDFECMLRSVDELYGKMDALFVEKGVLGISCRDRRRHTDNTVLNGVCFELIRRDLVPFSIDMVNKAMWTALGAKELQDLQSAGEFKTDAHFREEKSEGDFETVMSSFLATHSSTGMAGIKVWKVVRRYSKAHGQCLSIKRSWNRGSLT